MGQNHEGTWEPLHAHDAWFGKEQLPTQSAVIRRYDNKRVCLASHLHDCSQRPVGESGAGCDAASARWMVPISGADAGITDWAGAGRALTTSRRRSGATRRLPVEVQHPAQSGLSNKYFPRVSVSHYNGRPSGSVQG